MSMSRSGALWIAVALLLLAMVSAQAYQWPAVQLPLQLCGVAPRAPRAVCPPVTTCAPAETCPTTTAAACAPTEVAACPPTTCVTCPAPVGPASVTTTCPPVKSYAAAVTTTCAPATACPAPAVATTCPPAETAACPPVQVAECPPTGECPTACPGGCPTVPAATTSCTTTCEPTCAGGCPSTQPVTTCTTTPPPPSPDYDASKEAHFTGTIASFLNVPCSTGESGFTLRMENSETRTVLDGSQSYAANMNFCANVGDTVDVLGAPDASGNILARQITWQGQTFTFRSEQGYALWSGAASGSFAQYSGMWSNRPQQTVSGRVLWVNRYYPGGTCMTPGIEFALGTNLATEWDMVPQWRAQMMSNLQIRPTIVQLGPEWAVSEMLPDLRRGQRVTVAGVPAHWDRQPVLLAASVERVGTTVAFRGANGAPMWAGGWLGWCGAPVVATGFDACNIETVCGTVQQLANTEIAAGMGIHEIAVVQTVDNRMLRVDLGPQWFLQQQGVVLQCGQVVSVSGSVANIGGQPTMLATNVEVQGGQFALRSSAGIPAWSVAMICPLNLTASSAAFTPPPQAMAPPTTAVASAEMSTASAAGATSSAPSETASD
jgi:hypothetical protein